MTQTCSRCGDELSRPLPAHANYVRGDDMIVEEPTERLYALVHTDATRGIRDALVAEYGLNATQANRIMARQDPRYLKQTAVARNDAGDVVEENVVFDHTDLADADFDRREVDAPVTPESDPEVVRTDSVTEFVEVQKTGLVCHDCTKKSDEIIW